MLYSIIKKSQLEGARRLDAEYYQPEYLRVDQMVSKGDFVTIKKLGAKVFSGPFGATLKSESYQAEGIPFIRISNISDIFIQRDNDLVYISPDEHKRIYGAHLKTGDIVFSKIGTVGRLSIISDELGEVNISENNIGLRLTDLPTKERIYLLFFLLSRYGQSQIIRRASGNIQLKLNVSDIESVKMPEVNNEQKEKLEKVYDEILILRQKSESLYSQAEQMLLEELGLRDFSVEDRPWSVVKFSDVREAERMDAEYFEPRYDILSSKIKKNNARTLECFIKEYSTGFPFKSEDYREEGVPLIRINNIKKEGLDLSDTAFLSNKDYLLSPKDTAKAGDIVLSMSGSIGLAALIPDNIPKCSVNQRILKISSTGINKDYLVLLLNSIVGRYQLERIGTGGVQTNISYKDIKNILIPELSPLTQQKIASLVRASHAARKKAKELLEEAKRAVERLIEKGEN